MALDMAMLTNMGLPEILLWLLSFAIFYGVLSQVKMPENRESRAIISIVAAFFVLLATPVNLIEVLSGMSSSLILVVLGLLILMIFMEIAGIKHTEYKEVKDEKGKVIGHQPIGIPLFAHHKYAAFAAFLIIAILIFMSSGGMELLGFPTISMSSSGMTSIVFFIVIILAIVWMIGQKAK